METLEDHGCDDKLTEEKVRILDRKQRVEYALLVKTVYQEVIYIAGEFEKSIDAQNSTIYVTMNTLQNHLDNMKDIILEVFDLAHIYDFKHYRANGYRSLVHVASKCLTKILVLLIYYRSHSDSYMFRSSKFFKELISYTHALGQLRDCLHYAHKLIDFSPKGQLVASETLLDTPLADEIQMEMDMIDQECFYGRTLGFQYCESLKRAFEVVHVAIASYSHNYMTSSWRYTKLAGSLLQSSKYLLNPEERARRVVDATLNCDIVFCKAMWNLPETDMLHTMASIALPSLLINHVFKVHPKELILESLSGDPVIVKVPDSHIGYQPVQLRLMSSKFRVGQDLLPDLPVQQHLAHERSPWLVFQCHGGGFVSQTSRTHEAYLRHWAHRLDCPILCVDYSLAPEAPYPRALEEVYYAYAWALRNRHMLGTTAERIAIVGDSAGGNLLLATMLKAIQDNIPLPHGIVAIYTPVYIQFIPSPSRILSVMDPLLPVGILTRCLEAYAGDNVYPSKLIDLEAMEYKDYPEFDPTNSRRGSKLVRQRSSSFSLEDDIEGEDNEIQSILGKTAEFSLSDEKLSPPASPLSTSSHSISSSHHSVRGGNSTFTPGHTRHGSLPIMSSHTTPIIPRRHNNTRHFAQSPLYKFSKLRIRQNPFISPLHASDEMLKRMPKTHLVGCHLDPCLDDSVMFACRLDSLGVPVTLDAIPDIPHGFLNFAPVSSECRQAAKVCCARLREVLES